MRCGHCSKKLYASLECADSVKARACGDVGPRLTDGDWEYPLWILLPRMGLPAFRLEHVDVDNESAMIPLRNFDACVVIQIDNKGKAHRGASAGRTRSP
jgi:hypothetical protein